GRPRGAAVSDLPPGGGAVHAAHARDAARGLRAPAGAPGDGPARAARGGRGAAAGAADHARRAAIRARAGAVGARAGRPARALLDAWTFVLGAVQSHFPCKEGVFGATAKV